MQNSPQREGDILSLRDSAVAESWQSILLDLPKSRFGILWRWILLAQLRPLALTR